MTKFPNWILGYLLLLGVAATAIGMQINPADFLLIILCLTKTKTCVACLLVSSKEELIKTPHKEKNLQIYKSIYSFSGSSWLT